MRWWYGCAGRGRRNGLTIRLRLRCSCTQSTAQEFSRHRRSLPRLRLPTTEISQLEYRCCAYGVLARLHAELREHRGHVAVDRAHRDDQPIRDRRVGETLGHQLQYNDL